MNQTKNGYSGNVEEALYFIEDIMDRLQIPMFLHKDVARDVYEDKGRIDADEVHVMVRERSFTPFNLGMLRDWAKKSGFEVQEHEVGYFIDHKEAPIYIHVVKKNWKYLKNPDIKFFRTTEYFVPNPFNEYWKMRGMIK